MTREEARDIPELHIEVTDFIEDVFYMKLAINKTISLEVGEMASEWVKKKGFTKEELLDALNTADRMIANIKKYGVACYEWIRE
mgnify:CR=1 FL=1|jgi:hypothetical protein